MGRRDHAPCTVLPAAWRRRGSSRSRPAPGSRRPGSAAPLQLRTDTARCSPGRWQAAERKGRAVSLRSQLTLPSLRPVSPGAYPGAEEEHQGEANGTRDGGEHGRGAAGGRTAGCRGDEGRGRSLDSVSGRRLVSGRSRGCPLGWGCCRLEEVGLLGSELEWVWLSLLGEKSCVRLGGWRWLLYAPGGRLAKELNGVLHKQGHSSHSSPPSCLINSHRIDPDPLTLHIPPSEKAGTL